MRYRQHERDGRTLPGGSIIPALAGAAMIMAATPATAARVNITPNVPHVDIKVGEKTYRIQRIQDTRHKLQGNLALTSRPCPPHCLQPASPAPGVHLAGELEVLHFLKTKGEDFSGVLIDSRDPEQFRTGTIPGAVNVPAVLFGKENPYQARILTVLGARRLEDGTWDFGDARELMLFCQGASCPKSSRNIRALIETGYPPEKLHYYRGGVQAWALMGLPLIKPAE